MTQADVIIVGAGPAGALAAHALGQAGARVLLLEKQRLPRHKTCGGGLTHKVLPLLPFDITAVVERSVDQLILTHRLAQSTTLTGSAPFVHMVCRDRFDALLVAQAVATGGVQLHEGCAVNGVTVDPAGAGVEVSTLSHGRFKAAYLLGADGANGMVARSVGLLRHRVLLPAFEREIRVDADTAAHWHYKAAIDIGTLPGGYGWVFPKGDHLNVGVGCFAPSAWRGGILGYERAHLHKQLPHLAHRAHQAKGLQATEHASVVRSSGAVLPLRPPGAPIQNGRVLLLGDAAGLVEAFSGEGIYWALRSGQIAAATVQAQLQGPGGLPDYQAAIDTALMPDLLDARRLAHVYLWWPRGLYALMMRSPRAWHGVQRLMRGERRYSDVRQRFGVLGRAVRWLPLTL